MKRIIEKMKSSFGKLQRWINYHDLLEIGFGWLLFAGLIAFFQMLWNFTFGDLYQLGFFQTGGAFFIFFIMIGLIKSVNK